MNNKIFFLIFPLTVLLSCEKTASKKYESTIDSSLDKVAAKSRPDLNDSIIDRGKTEIRKNKNADWSGLYTCNFLRMKEESGDPRGWGMIYIDLKRESATFKLESYIGQISKDLVILNQNRSEIILSLKNQKDSTFIIHKKENQYFLKSNYIDKTVSEKETYLLIKK